MTDHLTALDAAFLELEEGNPSTHMHIGWTMVFDPLPGDATPSVDELRRLLDERLTLLPRFRRRLSSPDTGPLSWPTWEDEEEFDVAEQVGEASVPEPGGGEELLGWMARFYSQRLDRTRPLWEMVVLDGLEGGRWAIAAKVHHCLVDGVSGASVTTLLLDAEAHPDPESTGLLEGFEPPPDREEGIFGPLSLITHGVRAGVELALHPSKLRDALSRSRDVAQLLVRDELRGAPRTSLNVRIGRDRRLAELSVPLDEVKAIKRELGGTVNDVVLAGCAGGLRTLLESRSEEPDPHGVRAMVPVSVREASEAVALGNRVSSLFVELPVAEPEPRERHRLTIEATNALKESGQAAGAAAVLDVAALAPPVLHAAVARLSYTPRLFNITITNVPGPQTTLYALGAPLRHIFPLVPIFSHHAVGIAIVSYDGEVVFGLNADRNAVPDLDVLKDGIADSLAELRRLAA
ncbi:MAG TPA: wax ester/triacylglycerol synthase family O-acyltransferase [Solirubrobacterales bacterium]|nr:wax ester/triacylglycerol synthase family O-acyltransferase [Solirubrobacterales bacterium]